MIRSSAGTVARLFNAAEATGRGVDAIVEAALREYLPRLEDGRAGDPARLVGRVAPDIGASPTES